MPPNYWDYLKLDQMLALQNGFDPDDSTLLPDELHFIIVHQVYELWFKLILAELRLARDQLAAPQIPEEKVPHVVHHLRRVNRILETGISQWRVMETLTPQDFLAFRDKLIPASGFQSFQMRELEILLGLAESQRITYGKVHPLDHIRKLSKGSPAGELAWKRIVAVQEEQTLRDALHEWLYRTPIHGSSPGDEGDSDKVDTFVNDYLSSMEAYYRDQWERFRNIPETDPDAIEKKMATSLQGAKDFLAAIDIPEEERVRGRRIRASILFIEAYRNLPLLAWPRMLVDTIVELEENLVIFRSRHVRMVERTIGRRVGTGGSSGVDYLERTTKYRIFTELWAVRTVLLPKKMVPPLADRSGYTFAGSGDDA